MNRKFTMHSKKIGKPCIFDIGYTTVIKVLFFFAISTFAYSLTLSDDFNIPRNYLTDGVAGTIWDAFLYNGGLAATQDTMVTTAAASDGVLNLSSYNGHWENADDDGLFLYMDVPAGSDFTANVYIRSYTWVTYHDVGLMARLAPGRAENYVMSRYFANYGVDNAFRSVDDNVTTNDSGTSDAAMPYLQLEKSGSLFTVRASEDGVIYIDMASIERADMADVALQVGLYQATFSSNTGTVAIDDFSITISSERAKNPLPEDKTLVESNPVVLSWDSGFGAQSYDVYFGLSETAVADGDRQNMEYQGTLPAEQTQWTTDLLESGVTYYWRIDEFDGTNTCIGSVWSFTISYYVLENFESYVDSVELQQTWKVQENGIVELAVSPESVHEGHKAMKVNYTVPAAQQCRIVCDLPESALWDKKGIESLAIYIYGKPDNGMVPISLGLSQKDWGNDLVIIPMDFGQVHVQTARWQRWDINLRSVRESNPAINFDKISQISILIGSENTLQSASGTIYIDPIWICPQRCLGNDELQADLNKDCKIDLLDLDLIARQWMSGSSLGDTNGDEQVDLRDLAALSEQWQETFALWPVAKPDIAMLSPIRLDDVDVTGGLWQQRQTTVMNTSIWDVFGQCDLTGRIENFYIAAGLHSGSFQGARYNDSDVYKAMEGAAYILRKNPSNAALRDYMDKLIDVIELAQEPDGYLDTYGTLTSYTRWSDTDAHELYCAGHLFESAVEYYKTTGDDQLLNVAIRFADLIDSVFGPSANMSPPGHQEIELALIKLYEVTGESRYFDLAKFFIDQRGNAAGHSLYGAYSQDHIPFVSQTDAVGHAVRHGYMCTGAADIAMINQDPNYLTALDALWNGVTWHKQYITGGVGHHHYSEGYSSNYDLPNDLAYCETCASIANVMWNQRMFLIHGDGKYGDMMERTLLNGVLSGLSLDGGRYYYTNPLDAYSSVRPEWYGTACCPPNLVRVIANIGSYAFGQKEDVLYVNQYMQADSSFDISSGKVTLSTITNYPWDGEITITIRSKIESTFAVYLRIPGWARNQPFPSDLYRYLDESTQTITLSVNDILMPLEIEKGFAKISRLWQSGDQVKLSLPMEIRRVIANPSVSADQGLVSLTRGPVIYCFETHDIPSGALEHLLISDTDVFTAQYEMDMLNISGTESPGVVLSGIVSGIYDDEDGSISCQSETVRAIPYYAWMHRGQAHMRVWMPRDVSKVTPKMAPVYEMWGHWKLDETNGSIASDSSPDSNNPAQCQGRLSFDNNSVAGKHGLALAFDGIDDYLEIPDGFDNFSAGVTVSVWTYPTAYQVWSRFIDLGNGPGDDCIIFGTRGSSNDLFFEIYDGAVSGGQVVVDNAIQLNHWQMFTCTCDTVGNVKMYVNGRLTQTGTTARPQLVKRANNYVGRSNWSGDEYYQGYLDDIRIYTYPLTEQEVIAIYNGI